MYFCKVYIFPLLFFFIDQLLQRNELNYIFMLIFRAQLFTSLRADLHQDITAKRVFNIYQIE